MKIIQILLILIPCFASGQNDKVQVVQVFEIINDSLKEELYQIVEGLKCVDTSFNYPNNIAYMSVELIEMNYTDNVAKVEFDLVITPTLSFVSWMDEFKGLIVLNGMNIFIEPRTSSFWLANTDTSVEIKLKGHDNVVKKLQLDSLGRTIMPIPASEVRCVFYLEGTKLIPISKVKCECD